MIRSIQFVTGIVLLIALEIARVFFIMPFPGSQESETVELAYFLHRNIFYFRVVGWLIILFPIIHYFWVGTKTAKWLTTLCLLSYIFIFYLFNYKFQADKMFYQPNYTLFQNADANKIDSNKLVLGINIKGESKAYPIEIIGYHHQVRDTLNDNPIIVTYCTVCRTGRVYSPLVNGKAETFRLVGMDHFNAMFEDASTESWWRQVNGEAITGPLKGVALPEIPSQQMTLSAWLTLYPDSKIMQEDSTFKERYVKLDKYDEGTLESNLVRKDTLSWKEKSWIVGVQFGQSARAYDWNHLVNTAVINDAIGDVPIVVVLEKDSLSFHVWKRDSLEFEINRVKNQLVDDKTGSLWNMQGVCVEGPFVGKSLEVVQSYQEFWHSWQTFRPHSTQYPEPNH